MSERRMLTPKQAAEYLGVSLSMIYQLAEERRITHFRVGGKGKRGKLLFLPRDLDDFLASCRVTEPPDEDGPLAHIR